MSETYTGKAFPRIAALRDFDTTSTSKLRAPLIAPLPEVLSARSGMSLPQYALLIGLGLVCAVVLPWRGIDVSAALHHLLWGVFMINALIRLAACLNRPAAPWSADTVRGVSYPVYSVVVALYKEADITRQLLDNLGAIDYPRDRLDVMIVLEACDTETIEAFEREPLPAHVRIVVVPDGHPRTKPRALNHALALARGELLVVYDAEDRPHPRQLREAAHAFARSDLWTVCFQAPLRPMAGETFIGRQFSAEYAVQFDLLLPALVRMGLPFPLGGTSNHFRTDVLRRVGGWDAHNVTEDADLGIRLAQEGFQAGLITLPTEEAPPTLSRIWIPQRTRWIKGYMQTLIVHTRMLKPLRLQALLGLWLGIGFSVLGALSYAPFTAAVGVGLLAALIQTIHGQGDVGLGPGPFDLILFLTGTLSAYLTMAVAARNAGLTLRLSDLVGAPAYWALQSVAAVNAVWQLLVRPYHWDKTEHAPAEARQTLEAALAEAAD